MIEDKELRELFKMESQEHLQNLDSGLLRLEKSPEDSALLEAMFREAHSLKGSARMMGLSDIEALSHRLEDSLGAVRKGQAVLSPEMIDKMSGKLNDIRKLVRLAVSGEDVEAVVSEMPAQAQLTVEMKAPEDIDTDSKPPILELEHHEVMDIETSEAAQPSLAQSSRSEIEAFRIETIRLETSKLDKLTTQISELSVTTNRIAHRLSDMENVLGLWEGLRAGRNSSQRQSEIIQKVEGLLNNVTKAMDEDGSKLEFITGELEDLVRSISLLPLSMLFNLFPRMVRDMARERSKEIQLIIEGGDVTADKRIVEEMKDPLMHMIRNAIDHGIEPPEAREQRGKPRAGSIVLKAYRTATNVVIEVKDDGCGLDTEAIKRTALKRKFRGEEDLASMSPAELRSLIFVPGFSTSSFVTDVSGRGIGLDVVRTNVEGLKGAVGIESDPGRGCTFRAQMPFTLAATRVLILALGNISYAIPVECVETTRLVPRHEIFTLEGRDAMLLYGRPVSVAKLSDILELPPSKPGIRNPNPQINPSSTPCIVISIGDERLALLVDAVLDEQEIVLKPQSHILKRVRNIAGATILGTGKICMMLNPADLMKSARKRSSSTAAGKEIEKEVRAKVILLAEDSITTRTQMKRILEGAGYEVVTAVDGVDAFNKLGLRSFDALVTDIQMPHMDGLTLTAKVRQDGKYREMPVILVTSLTSEEDRKRGIEAGANAYITKPAFDKQLLLDALQRLV